MTSIDMETVTTKDWLRALLRNEPGDLLRAMGVDTDTVLRLVMRPCRVY